MTNPPVRWRQAVVTWAALAVVVTIVTEVAEPALQALPRPLDVVALTGVVVAMMTWLVMPVMNHWFSAFLRPERLCEGS